MLKKHSRNQDIEKVIKIGWCHWLYVY